MPTARLTSCGPLGWAVFGPARAKGIWVMEILTVRREHGLAYRNHSTMWGIPMRSVERWCHRCSPAPCTPMSCIVCVSLSVHSTTNSIISFVGCLINPDFSHSPPQLFPSSDFNSLSHRQRSMLWCFLSCEYSPLYPVLLIESNCIQCPTTPTHFTLFSRSHIPPKLYYGFPRTVNFDSAPKGLDCNNCGWFAKFRPCQTRKNGNKGVLFAIVHVLLPLYQR